MALAPIGNGSGAPVHIGLPLSSTSVFQFETTPAGVTLLIKPDPESVTSRLPLPSIAIAFGKLNVGSVAKGVDTMPPSIVGGILNTPAVTPASGLFLVWVA